MTDVTVARMRQRSESANDIAKLAKSESLKPSLSASLLPSLEASFIKLIDGSKAESKKKSAHSSHKREHVLHMLDALHPSPPVQRAVVTKAPAPAKSSVSLPPVKEEVHQALPTVAAALLHQKSLLRKT